MSKNGHNSQIEQECSAWRRTLEFLSQENTFLKTRLSEVINHLQPGVASLSIAEQFHQAFIRTDEMIIFLRSDISALHGSLTKINTGAAILPEVGHQQKELRRELKAIEAAFIELKFQFNNYLSEVL